MVTMTMFNEHAVVRDTAGRFGQQHNSAPDVSLEANPVSRTLHGIEDGSLREETTVVDGAVVSPPTAEGITLTEADLSELWTPDTRKLRWRLTGQTRPGGEDDLARPFDVREVIADNVKRSGLLHDETIARLDLNPTDIRALCELANEAQGGRITHRQVNRALRRDKLTRLGRGYMTSRFTTAGLLTARSDHRGRMSYEPQGADLIAYIRSHPNRHPELHAALV